jgi:hypothetical protein
MNRAQFMFKVATRDRSIGVLRALVGMRKQADDAAELAARRKARAEASGKPADNGGKKPGADAVKSQADTWAFQDQQAEEALKSKATGMAALGAGLGAAAGGAVGGGIGAGAGYGIGYAHSMRGALNDATTGPGLRLFESYAPSQAQPGPLRLWGNGRPAAFAAANPNYIINTGTENYTYRVPGRRVTTGAVTTTQPAGITTGNQIPAGEAITQYNNAMTTARSNARAAGRRGAIKGAFGLGVPLSLAGMVGGGYFGYKNTMDAGKASLAKRNLQELLDAGWTPPEQ